MQETYKEIVPGWWWQSNITNKPMEYDENYVKPYTKYDVRHAFWYIRCRFDLPRSFEEIGTLIAKKYNAKIEYIPFPEHLKGKYQEHTCAKRQFNHDFITVESYLND